jgi:hypothetical protein
MRATVALAFSLSVAMMLFVAGFLSASALMAKPATEALAHIDVPDLWPSEPRRVETASQTLERVPGAAAPVSLQPSGALPLAQAPVIANASSEIETTSPAASVADDVADDNRAGADPQHQAWCERRYRSYSSEDDSYSAYSGERKPCISPYLDIASSNTLGNDGTADAGVIPVGLSTGRDVNLDHVERCQARYASYRTEDNSYQPFSGPRRTCTLD